MAPDTCLLAATAQAEFSREKKISLFAERPTDISAPQTQLRSFSPHQAVEGEFQQVELSCFLQLPFSEVLKFCSTAVVLIACSAGFTFVTHNRHDVARRQGGCDLLLPTKAPAAASCLRVKLICSLRKNCVRLDSLLKAF